jgi:hypothetical protein
VELTIPILLQLNTPFWNPNHEWSFKKSLCNLLFKLNFIVLILESGY